MRSREAACARVVRREPACGGDHDPATRRHSVASRHALARELLDGLAEAVLTTDGTGRVTLLNAMAAELIPEITSAPSCPAARWRPWPGRSPATPTASTPTTAADDCAASGDSSPAPAFAWYVRDATEEHARADALLAERSRTAFLAQAGSRLGLSLHRDQVLLATTTLAVPYLADVAVALPRPAAPAEPHARWIRYADGEPAPVSGLAAGDADQHRARAGRGADRRPHRAEPLARRRARRPGRPAAARVRPPRHGAGQPDARRQGSVGALLLVRRAGRAGFDPRDIELAREFAARAGAALATADLHGEQAHLARVLQASLLPPELPSVPGVTLAGGYRAAGDSLRIGGDFYEVFPHPRGALFALGDVCGKGVGAAVLTGRVRQSLQTLRLVEQRPLELIDLLNQALFDAPDAARRSQFTTLLLGSLHRGPGRGGHPDRRRGPPGTAAGHHGRHCHPGPGRWHAGGGADGPTVRRDPGAPRPGRPAAGVHRWGDRGARPRDGAMFGEARLRAAVAAAAGQPPAALIDRVLRAVDDWLDGQAHDDIAMLAVGASVPA